MQICIGSLPGINNAKQVISLSEMPKNMLALQNPNFVISFHRLTLKDNIVLAILTTLEARWI